MQNGTHPVYEFGGFQLDPARQKLFRQGQPVALTPKAFETLVFLVKNRDRTLLKDELMQAVWAGTFVEESNLSQNIFLLRKALGDDRNGHSFIHTVPRRGYRFVAPVTEIEGESITSLPGTRDWEYWKKNSPFRSLTVFEEEDAWLFFGREAETADLVERVTRSAVVAVVGNSGSGKSSLLRAGLIPALRENRFPNGNGSDKAMLTGDSWKIAVVRPSGAPFDYLAEGLPGQLAPELSVKEQAEFISDCRAKLPADGDALRNVITALAGASSTRMEHAGRTRVLLIVDQFEELFTLTAKLSVRDRYIDALLGAARLDGAIKVHLVLSLRADFYGRCLDHVGLSRCLETSLFNLTAMTLEQMRETIEERLQLTGGRAEPGLIDSLLEDVGAEPGNLALLEHAMGQLWERCGGPGCTFTNLAYNEIGRLRGALGRHADGVLQGLDERQKLLTQKIFLELVHLGEGAQDTRRRVLKAELQRLSDPQEVEQLLGRLASSRLIATGRESEETFVEVSHEALIREWPALRKWLEENREELALGRRLAQAAEEWRSLNGDPGALLQGARLVLAENWLSRHKEASDLLQEFVRASIATRAEIRRNKREARCRELRRKKQLAQGLRWLSCVLSVLLLASGWFAYRQGIRTKARAMAAKSADLLRHDPGQALALAIQSWGLAKTEEAHLAVAKAFPQTIAILKHDGPVTSAGYSPDGRRLGSISGNTGRIWDAETGRLIATLRGHTGKIQNADFYPDGKRVVTTSDDHTARIWNAENGSLLFTLHGHSDRVWRVTFSPDGRRFVTSSDDHTARVWNSEDGRLLVTLRGHTGTVGTARFSPDGQRIVTAGWDHTARVWRSSDGALLNTLNHENEVLDAFFTPDNQRILTSDYRGATRAWNRDGRLLFTLFHEGMPTDLAFSPDGQRIATSSLDQTARVWSLADGRWLFTLRRQGPVQNVEFSRDGKHILTSSSDQTARVWDSADGRLLAVLQGHTGELRSADFSPDGKRVATASTDSTVRIWNLAAGLSLKILPEHSGFMQSATFSNDGERVVTASSDGTAGVWDSGDGRLLATLKGHSNDVLAAQFSPDSQHVVTASKDRTARVWNAADGRLLFTLSGHTGYICSALFSPDGQRIVTASEDHTARIWNAADGRLLFILQGHEDRVWGTRFSPTGDRVLTAGLDPTARVWNLADGRLLFTLHQGSPVWAAQFSPDGQRIVTASLDKNVRIWNAADGNLLRSFTLQGNVGDIKIVTVSLGGQRIIAVDNNNVLWIWNTDDARLVAELPGHTDEICCVKFSLDGRYMTSGSADHTVRVWDIQNGRLVAVLQGHAYSAFLASFSPDGRRIVSVSTDQTARIWEILTLDDIERILSK
jgi:WD40 repeat protein/DNA-binding winged helix-turn-helix (wHTH) protein